jgi:lysozyme
MIDILIKWLQAMFTTKANPPAPTTSPVDTSPSRLAKPWHISEQGVQFIAGWEKFRAQLYDTDGAGKPGNTTIGYGHLVHMGPISGAPSEAPFKNGITEQQARDLMKNDLIQPEQMINQHVQVPLFQYEYDALVDFIYNLGSTGMPVLDTVNLGQYEAVGDRIKLYDEAGHQYVEGLAKRRAAEVNLFDHGVYDASH